MLPSLVHILMILPLLKLLLLLVLMFIILLLMILLSLLKLLVVEAVGVEFVDSDVVVDDGVIAVKVVDDVVAVTSLISAIVGVDVVNGRCVFTVQPIDDVPRCCRLKLDTWLLIYDAVAPI